MKGKERCKILKEIRQKNTNVDYNIYKSTCCVNLKTILGYKNEDEKYTFLRRYDDGFKED